MTDECISIIQDAICAKIMQNLELAERLRKSKLPFCHYYVYAGKVVDVSGEHSWFVQTFEDIRTALREL